MADTLALEKNDKKLQYAIRKLVQGQQAWNYVLGMLRPEFHLS